MNKLFNSFNIRKVTLYILFFSSSTAFSQYYPGGLNNTNLKIWLDAADASTVTTSSSTISQWNDKSGTGINVSQATAASRPSYLTNQINGLPAVQTNGTSTYLSGTFTVNGLTQMSLLGIATPATNNNSGSNTYAVNFPVFYWGMETGSWGQVGIELNTMNNGFYGFGWRFGTSQASADVFYNPSPAPSGAKVFCAAHNNAVEKAYYNGFNITTPTLGSLTSKLSTLTNSPNTFGIGTGQTPYGGNGFGGNNKIGEILIYNTSLSNTQLIILQNYLAAKWGVTMIANSKFAPPTATTYNYNLVGVGRESSSDSVAFTRSTDGFGFEVGSTTSDFLKDNGDYICAAHTSPLSVSLVTTFLPAGTAQRWADEWYIDKTDVGSNGGNINLFFNYTAYGIGGSPGVASNYQLLYRSTAGSTSYSVIATAVPSASGNKVSFLVDAANLSNGYYTIGTTTIALSPLPVELLSFTAKPNTNNRVDLNWITATEINNDFFTVEKTKDGAGFESVVVVKGAGNSTSVLNYSSEDNSPYEGVSYYRLKQTDFNGAYTYSALKMVDFSATLDFSFNVYPNPSEGENVNISVTADKGEEVLIAVYDMTGKKSYSKVLVTENKGENIYAIDPANTLAPGIYFITATSHQNIFSKKLIVK